MKKIVLISAIALFLVVTPVLADKDGHGRDKNTSEETEDDVISAVVSPAPSCDPSDDWKNHGAYVSCVARLHQGGAVVSAAAKAEIGKPKATPAPEEEEDEDSETSSPSPSFSPTASPSASPSGSPSATPASGAPLVEGAKIEISALIQTLQNIITSLQHLMTD